MPFLSLLAILFVALKLTDVIDWSWWWVTAPLWAIPATALFAALTALVTLIVRESRKK